ncbi:MAG: hypothetical protein M9930_19930 [Anaerolineae bacterium]|nr:hypothetical protein [Anaerolineae bacterium]
MTYDGPLVTSKPVSPRSLAGIFTGLTASSGLLPPNALFWKIDDEDQPECGLIEAHRRKLVIDDATAFTILAAAADLHRLQAKVFVCLRSRLGRCTGANACTIPRCRTSS